MPLVFCNDLPQTALPNLVARYQLTIEWVKPSALIPGSYWGENEAGLINDTLYLQAQTPVHSALHETCHFVCMDSTRRTQLDTNAGGDYNEENAVCYLQLLLSDYLEAYNREQHFADMDEWGYSFRLGSAKRWFLEDAEDAKSWLIDKNLINSAEIPLWRLRED